MPAPRRRVAGCTHMTVTRLYGANATCSVCRRPGAFGWVYLCTQDHEDVLEHAVADLDVVGDTPPILSLLLCPR